MVIWWDIPVSTKLSRRQVKAIDECVKDTVEAAKANDYEVSSSLTTVMPTML